jgi:hypothetical protein
VSTWAGDPKAGDKMNNGIFLYRNHIEMYWDDWIAYPLSDKGAIKQTSQANLTIVGEGKTVDFVGNVNINCDNSKFSWKSGNNFSTILPSEEEVASVVPDEVMKEATQFFCNHASIPLPEHAYDYFIYQNNNEQIVPLYNGVITIDKAPFSIRFYNKYFDQKNYKTYQVRLAVFNDKESWKAIVADVNKDKSPYFIEGSALVFSNKNYTYDGVRFTNDKEGGSHYLPYGDTPVNALNLLKKEGEYYKLEFKIDTFILGSYKEKGRFKDKRVKITDSNISEFYLALFNDVNLDNYIDEDELIKFTVKFKK